VNFEFKYKLGTVDKKQEDTSTMPTMVEEAPDQW